jgi:hypothetical protein
MLSTPHHFRIRLRRCADIVVDHRTTTTFARGDGESFESSTGMARAITDGSPARGPAAALLDGVAAVNDADAAVPSRRAAAASDASGAGRRDRRGGAVAVAAAPSGRSCCATFVLTLCWLVIVVGTALCAAVLLQSFRRVGTWDFDALAAESETVVREWYAELLRLCGYGVQETCVDCGVTLPF